MNVAGSQLRRAWGPALAAGVLLVFLPVMAARAREPAGPGSRKERASALLRDPRLARGRVSQFLRGVGSLHQRLPFFSSWRISLATRSASFSKSPLRHELTLKCPPR